MKLIAGLLEAKFRLARHYLEWCVRGPVIEACTAISAMAQEEYGQARVLRGLLDNEYTTSGIQLPDLVAAPAETWIDLICLAALFDPAITRILEAGTDANLALGRRAGKIVQEERFHEVFASQWFVLLGQEPATRSLLMQQTQLLRSQILLWLEQLNAPLQQFAKRPCENEMSVPDAWNRYVDGLLHKATAVTVH